jgi:hypothetical protein
MLRNDFVEKSKDAPKIRGLIKDIPLGHMKALSETVTEYEIYHFRILAKRPFNS